MDATLLLLRHAKSSWERASLDDFRRPLAPRGRRAAPLMAREMARRGWLPDRVLVSPARRARETWDLVRNEWPDPPAATLPDRLYMASAEAMRDLVRATGPAGCLLVIGHNPGMEECAARLAGEGSSPDALAALRLRFPTAGLARFVVDTPWSTLDFGSARLTHFIVPRALI